MTEGKAAKVVNKRIMTADSIKTVTSFGKHIEGRITKISHIGDNIKNIIVEGSVSEIEVIEMAGFGVISAKLNDGTGNVILMMLEKGNLPFRELVSRIKEGQKYRVFGDTQEDLIILVSNIEIIS